MYIGGKKRSFKLFHYQLGTDVAKLTVASVADFKASIVDTQITGECYFQCCSVDFQVHFARRQRPANVNLFCGISARLDCDFNEVKFFTILRILDLMKREQNYFSWKYFSLAQETTSINFDADSKNQQTQRNLSYPCGILFTRGRYNHQWT